MVDLQSQSSALKAKDAQDIARTQIEQQQNQEQLRAAESFKTFMQKASQV